MDLSKITDIKELKAMAYDQLAILDQAQTNLKYINERMAIVSAEEPPKESKTKNPA